MQVLTAAVVDPDRVIDTTTMDPESCNMMFCAIDATIRIRTTAPVSFSAPDESALNASLTDLHSGDVKFCGVVPDDPLWWNRVVLPADGPHQRMEDAAGEDRHRVSTLLSFFCLMRRR